MSESEVIFEERGSLGLITLNRPRALNALTADMCRQIRTQLELWAGQAQIVSVAIRGAGEKAFCAGGDVVKVVDAYKEGGDGWREFFYEEYRMNVAIAEFPKPYISFVDGIAMGGGVGVSMPGDFWVASERTLFAMPETGLGLFPDVGGGWFLPRLAGSAGMYLALTGARLKTADLYALKIASHVIASEKLEGALDALADIDSADAVKGILDDMHEDPGAGPIEEVRALIDRHFCHESLDGILESLAAADDAWCAAVHADLLKKSPTSLKVTFEQLKKGANMPDFRANMAMEYRIVHAVLAGHDFAEGVRAILIDKDQNPRWEPARLEDVSADAVAAFFAPLGSGHELFD